MKNVLYYYYHFSNTKIYKEQELYKFSIDNTEEGLKVQVFSEMTDRVGRKLSRRCGVGFR